ncbi:MAG: hypothetical protein LBR32_03820 [Propionibacteriaceae bacterium]|jgi:hypothetical protein|nr:hypothetical protein [Propionibacteriaceae bacterium]
MEWIADTSVGQWVVDGTAGAAWASAGCVVPRGFEACVRVFHPMGRSAVENPDSWEDLAWARVAEAFGTTMHPLAQSAALMRVDPLCGDPPVRDGWSYHGPAVGSFPQLSQVAPMLAAHTSTPDSGVAAVWEGWGGLVSSAGRMVMCLSAGPSLLAPLAYAATAWSKVKSAVTSHLPAREPPPGSGILPYEAAAGPRLELPDRAYILFSAGVDEFADEDWPSRAPWTDELWANTPSLLWPDDHAWLLGTEIDWEWTLIGCSRALADALMASGVEACEVPLDADLTWHGDQLNR